MIGVTQTQISHWANKKRPVPVQWATAIERATNGAVSRKDLRPDDWQRIWPELCADHPTPTKEAA